MTCNSSYLRSFSLVMFLLSHSAVSIPNKCNFNVKMKMLLRNDGFHRNLTYSISFNSDNEYERWLFGNCAVGLDQVLPAGVYANPDELGDLRRQQRVNIVPKNRVNIELATEQSSPTSVYVYGRLEDSNVKLWLPVHARYHAAKPGGGLARNDLPAPKLYIRCPNAKLGECGETLKEVTFLCSGSSREKCLWKEVPYSLLTDTPHWDVPVGNLDHYYVVSICTAAVVGIGSLYLLKTLHDFKLRENKKNQ